MILKIILLLIFLYLLWVVYKIIKNTRVYFINNVFWVDMKLPIKDKQIALRIDKFWNIEIKQKKEKNVR